jgi:hypothetical protein
MRFFKGIICDDISESGSPALLTIELLPARRGHFEPCIFRPSFFEVALRVTAPSVMRNGSHVRRWAPLRNSCPAGSLSMT